MLSKRSLGFFSVCLAMAGCFLYGAEDDSEALPPRTDPPDANTPDQGMFTGGDGAVETGARDPDASTLCSPRAAFTSVNPVSEVNTPDDETHAHLSTDELTLYLGRGSAVAVYTRDKKTDPWKGGAGMDVNGSNAQNVRVTDDTLRAYFDAYLGGGINATRLIAKSRPTTTTPWGGPETNRSFDLGTPNGNSQNDPFITADEKMLFFATDSLGPLVLAVTTRVNDTWQAPVVLNGTSSGAGDRKPVVSFDQTALYFQSARPPGKVGEGLIWVAHRVASSEGVDFADVAPAQGLQATVPGSNSWPVWLSPDNCRLYFMSTRPGGKGKVDLWLGARSP